VDQGFVMSWLFFSFFLFFLFFLQARSLKPTNRGQEASKAREAALPRIEALT
jgi:hypothetical protein